MLVCVLHYLLKHTTLSLSPPRRLCNVLSESLYLLHGVLPLYHEHTVGGWAYRYMSLPLTIPSLLPHHHTVITSQTKGTKVAAAVKKLSVVYQAGPKGLLQAPLVDVLSCNDRPTWNNHYLCRFPQLPKLFSVTRKLENIAKCRINYFSEVLRKSSSW